MRKTKKMVWAVLAAVVAIAIIILIVVLLVNKNVVLESKVNLRFDVNTNIPSGELNSVRKHLYGTIRNNTNDFNEDVTYYGVVRNYQESLADYNNTAIFIVDFDDIKQSYTVSVLWPDPNDGSPNVMISCPILDSKYPATKCVTEANSSTEIVSYLPYVSKTDFGMEYKVIGDYSNGGLYLSVEVNSCGNTAIAEKTLDEVKSWILSYRMNPDNYLFFVPTNLCDEDITLPYSYIQANHADTNDENVNKKLPYFIPNMYNVYPVVDEDNNVVSIKAEVSGCTDFQTEPMTEEVNEYLEKNGISYPVEFEYCVGQN